MNTDLLNQRILVIGGSSGIGFATTDILVKQNADVIITGRSEENLAKAKERIKGIKEIHCFNFTDETSIKHFFASIEPIHHMVIVAGGEPLTGSFLDTDIDKMRNYFEQKFWGVVNTAKYGIPKVIKGGSIVFFIGGAGRLAIPGTSGLAAVNCAIEGMAMSIAREIAPTRINVIAPGLIDTHVYDSMSNIERETFYNQVASSLPVGRVGTPEDIAQGVLFLITNKYMTGTILDIDGGSRLKGC